MRLVTAKPSPHFVNLNECTYRCDCGEQGDYFVAQER